MDTLITLYGASDTPEALIYTFSAYAYTFKGYRYNDALFAIQGAKVTAFWDTGVSIHL